MKIVNVLLVVDVENAIATGNLQGNVYMVDNNKTSGSHGEGGSELYTACRDGQLVQWRAVGVVPQNDVKIHEFFGDAPSEGIITPREVYDGIWAARVESRGVSNTYQYSMYLSFNGHTMWFDPFLVVTA